MISRIFILTSGGILCYSRNFLPSDDDDISMDDLVGGFLTAISCFAHEIEGGEIKALSFKNFNFIYETDNKSGAMFVLVVDTEDLEEEARERVSLMKEEFIKRYASKLENFTGCVSDFAKFDDFVDENILIPPKILLVGEPGVGKTTIMNLFPGETVLQIDEDLNEIIQKPIGVDGIEKLKQILLREIDLQDLVNNTRIYRKLLDTIDVICIVTNSAGTNLGNTKNLLIQLKPKLTKPDIYILANFQDQKSTAFSPEKIEEALGFKTYGFSAVKIDATDRIFSIFTEILKKSVVDKMKQKQKLFSKNLSKSNNE